MEKKYNAKIDNLKNDIEKLKQNVDTIMEKLVDKNKEIQEHTSPVKKRIRFEGSHEIRQSKWAVL